MFDFNGLLGVLLCMGIIIGVLVFGIPAYFIGKNIGKHIGKQEAYTEAIQHKVLDIKYNTINGEKQFIWGIK